MSPLPVSFFDRSPLDVAPDLLGAVLVHETPAGRAAGRIVETEAYTDDDPAMHGWQAAFGLDGRVVPAGRAADLFGPPGTTYLYKVYYRSWLLNVVCLPEGQAGAVLVRALEPTDGLEAMRERRPAARSERELANGPGKLTEALGLWIAPPAARHPLHGHRVDAPPLWFEPGEPPPAVATSSRIGVSRGADRAYRFFVPGHPCVSPGEPSDQRLARRSASQFGSRP